MITIVCLCVIAVCAMVWNTPQNTNRPTSRKLIDIRSGNRVFIANSEHEAMELIQSKSDEASNGDICYVRYVDYLDNGTVRTIAGVYNVVDGVTSITYLK